MVSSKLYVVTVAFGLLFSYLILRGTRNLTLRQSFFWLLAALALTLSPWVLYLVDWVAVRSGIHYPPSLLFSLIVVIVLFKLFLQDVEIAKLRTQRDAMVQKLALLETHFASAYRENE